MQLQNRNVKNVVVKNSKGNNVSGQFFVLINKLKNEQFELVLININA